MKILTIILIMVASLITGYVIAQYNRGAVRLYSLSGAEGVFSPIASTSYSGPTRYSVEINTFSPKSVYISDEKPKYSTKASKLSKLFSYWTRGKGQQLNGVLSFKSKNISHKKWVKVTPKSYDAEHHKAVFEIEPLSLRRKGLEQLEDPEKLDYTTVSEPDLVVLSIR